jgi:hypothetical protein
LSAFGKYCSKGMPGFFRMFIRKRRAFSLRTCRQTGKAGKHQKHENAELEGLALKKLGVRARTVRS